MAKKSTDEIVTDRFIEVMNDFTGPGKRWRFKRNFANAMKMIPQELTAIENGGRIMTRHLQQINQLTGVNMNWLICGKGEKYAEQKNDQLSIIESRLEKIEAELWRKK